MSNFNKSCGCPPTLTPIPPQRPCPCCGGSAAGQGPDGPMGPVGATGPAGPGIISEFNPDDASNYKKGQLIVDGGNLYLVNKDDPQGVPGSSPDYTLLPPDVTEGPAGPEGPQGPPGIEIPATFDPSETGNYKEGQLIYYQDTIYMVNKDNPSGLPGESPDYTAVTPDPVSGPPGPTGPNGLDLPQAFNPDDAGSYKAGNVIYYEGRLYVVCRDHPHGVPGSSPDYCPVNAQIILGPSGPAGPPGLALPITWDPNQASSYVEGDIIYYKGSLYWVNKDNPHGTPGESPDYDLIDPGVLLGPTGPTGIGYPIEYNPDDNVNLLQGQLVISGGQLYVVNKDAPSGAPGSSPDFSPVNTGVVSSGDTGVGGPTGPTGPCGCTDDITNNAITIVKIQNCTSIAQNQINNNQSKLDDLEDKLDDLEDQIQDNTDALADIKNQIENNQDSLDGMTNPNTYCGGTPYIINAQTGNNLINTGGCGLGGYYKTKSTTVQEGTPEEVGCFFGCTVYRQCYTGLVGNSDGLLLASFYDTNVGLAVSNGPVTGIVKYGGSWQNGKGVWNNIPGSGPVGGEGSNVTVDSNGNLVLTLEGAYPTQMKDRPYYFWIDYIVCTDLPTPDNATDDHCNPLMGGGVNAIPFDPGTMDQLAVNDLVSNGGSIYQVMATPAQDMNQATPFDPASAPDLTAGQLVTDPATGNIYLVNNDNPQGTPSAAADGPTPNPDYTLMYKKIQ